MIELAEVRKRRDVDQVRSAIETAKAGICAALDFVADLVVGLAESGPKPIELIDYEEAGRRIGRSKRYIADLVKNRELVAVWQPSGRGETPRGMIDARDLDAAIARWKQ